MGGPASRLLTMHDTSHRNLVDAAWDWAVAETAVARETGQFWVLEGAAGLISAAVAVLIAWRWESRLMTEAILGALIILAGLVLMACGIFLLHLVLAPYRQRNGLRALIPSLVATHQEELEKAREAHRGEMDRAQGEIEDLKRQLESTRVQREALDTLGAQLIAGEDLLKRRVKSEADLNKLVAEIEIWYRWTLGFVTLHLGEAEGALFKSTTGATPPTGQHLLSAEHGNVLASLDRMNGNLKAIIARAMPSAEPPSLPFVDG